MLASDWPKGKSVDTMFGVGRPSLLWAVPPVGRVVLAFIRKQTEQAKEKNPVNSIPL